MWFSVFTLCGAIAIATVTALPSINPGCKADAVLLDILSAVDPIGASKFCSSFILQTTTVISTSLTVQQIITLSTAPDVQTTTTATDILTTTVTSTSSTTLPNPTVTKSTLLNSLIARNNGPPALPHLPPPPIPPPPGLENYASSFISTACSCFITSAPVTTVVSTTVTSTTTTSTSIIGPLNTDTFISSVTLVVTDVITTTETFPPTSTVTEQVTTTDIISQCTNVAAAPTYSQAVGNFAASYTGTEYHVTAEVCCQMCYELINCATYLFSDVCFLYLVSQSFGNSQKSLECPYGLLSNAVAMNDGDTTFYDMVNLGPCGIP